MSDLTGDFVMLPQVENIREEAYRAFNARNFRLAIQEAVKAITVSSCLAWPYYLTGVSLSAQGKPREAVAYLERYLSLDTARFSQNRQRASRMIRQLNEQAHLHTRKQVKSDE
jgi:hypothetical protein